MAIYIPLDTPKTSPADRARAALQIPRAFPSKIVRRAGVLDSPQETFVATFGYFFDGFDRARPARLVFRLPGIATSWRNAARFPARLPGFATRSVS